VGLSIDESKKFPPFCVLCPPSQCPPSPANVLTGSTPFQPSAHLHSTPVPAANFARCHTAGEFPPPPFFFLFFSFPVPPSSCLHRTFSRPMYAHTRAQFPAAASTPTSSTHTETAIVELLAASSPSLYGPIRCVLTPFRLLTLPRIDRHDSPSLLTATNVVMALTPLAPLARRTAMLSSPSSVTSTRHAQQSSRPFHIDSSHTSRVLASALRGHALGALERALWASAIKLSPLSSPAGADPALRAALVDAARWRRREENMDMGMNMAELEAGSGRSSHGSSPSTTDNSWKYGTYDALAHWPGAHLAWTKANASCGFYTRGLWSWSLAHEPFRRQSFWVGRCLSFSDADSIFFSRFLTDLVYQQQPQRLNQPLTSTSDRAENAWCRRCPRPRRTPHNTTKVRISSACTTRRRARNFYFYFYFGGRFE